MEVPSTFQIDVPSATAAELQALLSRGAVTSVQVVKAYLAQIERHNHRGLKLHAIAAVAPEDILLEQARRLDDERGKGNIRGPLHGIPITIKDAIVTAASLGMPTQAGAVAFETAEASKSAEIVDQLLEAGTIIIAKASMTEFCGHRAAGITAGYSAAAGQTQSPYIRGGRRADDGIAGHTSAGGSSSGSGAGVAAGFAPLSVGTETAGSLILPSNRAGLYGLRLTHGAAPMSGIFGLAREWDTVGPMAKGAADVAALAEALMGHEARSKLGKGGLLAALDANGLKDLKIGFVEFDEWKPMMGHGTSVEDLVMMKQEYNDAIMRLREKQAHVLGPLSLPFAGGVSHEGKTVKQVSDSQFCELFEQVTAYFRETPVRTVAELVKFNNEHAERAMPQPHPDQKELLLALKNDMKPEDAAELALIIRKKAREGLADAFSKADVIVAPSDSMFAASSIAAAGYTAGVVPLGYLTGGQPQGLTVAAKAGAEFQLIRFMSGYEATFPKRRVPPLLLE